MAARINKIRHDDETRAKIKTSQLLNRLQDHAFGLIELSQTQVRSIEIALKKTLPDLSSVEHTGDVETSYVVRMPSVVASLEDWDRQATAEVKASH